VSPGMLHVSCASVKFMIQAAYVLFADDRAKLTFEIDPATGVSPVAGGPAWMKSDQYDIEAKAEGNPSGRMMQGPMLQALLEDRFRLKLHREAREIPVYDLIVAKGGFKLQPLKAGSCTPFDPFKSSEPGITPADLIAGLAKTCGSITSRRPEGPGDPATVEFHGMSMDEIAQHLSRPLDRPVVNKTGIAGMFDVHLEFAPDQATPGFLAAGAPAAAIADDPPGGPSIFTAIQAQIGLKLEPAKGPGQYIVVDSVERPSEN
jgi:uncharacterized protein (TIGR03435 family)